MLFLLILRVDLVVLKRTKEEKSSPKKISLNKAFILGIPIHSLEIIVKVFKY
jgi:hypothetical protein